MWRVFSGYSIWQSQNKRRSDYENHDQCIKLLNEDKNLLKYKETNKNEAVALILIGICFSKSLRYPALDLFESDSINIKSRQNFDSKTIRSECVMETKLILIYA